MLSVLIPVYNFDVRDLVKTLSNQAERLDVAFEIIVIDDASCDNFKIINSVIKDFSGVKYMEEEVNLGRSRIRNKLVTLAHYDNILFLDCDSTVITDDYLKKYIDTAKERSVIYGGTLYNKNFENFSPKQKLHWLHGVKREQSSAQSRNQFPNRSFKTNNFFIHKSIFQNIVFNEKIKGYGHEDTLFGYELSKHNISVYHIDNPVVHMGLESSEEFLRKTREGIKNLKRIMKINGNEKMLVKDITLLAFYKTIKDFGLDSVMRYLYYKQEYRLRRNLMSSKPNLFLFDLYKLGYLCTLNGDVQ